MHEAIWDVHWWQHVSNRDLHPNNVFHFYILSLDGIRRWLRAELWYVGRKIQNSEEFWEIIKEVVIRLWHPREHREFGAK